MSVWRHLRHGARVLVHRADADRELSDELEHYVEQAAMAHEKRGLSREAALKAARAEVGSHSAVREQVRSGGWEETLRSLGADVRYAMRMLGKARLFTAVAILIIALGSGAVTTIYSAMNALVLRPLPGTHDADRLVNIERRDRTMAEGMQSSTDYLEWMRPRVRTLSSIAAWSKVTFAMSTGGEGIGVYGNIVSGNYFSTLDVRPALGRFFLPEEDATPMGGPVLVVSHAFWQSKLGGDSSVVGRVVRVNGAPYTLIGVAPPEFHGAFTPLLVEAWVPLSMHSQLRPSRNREHAVWLWTFGRMQDGATVAGVKEELESLTAAYIAEGREPQPRNKYGTLRLTGMTGLPADAREMAVAFIGLLLGAAFLVLLIGSVNVASMLSARGIARQRELAVRAALGAGRGRLVRQLLTEIVTLFLLGAIGGILITTQATRAIERIAVPAEVPMALEVSPDIRVFVFALGLSLVTGLVFGLAPALRAVDGDLVSRLRDGSSGSGTRRSRIGKALIAGQLALSLVLLVAAGLFLRAMSNGTSVDKGFEPTGVQTTNFNTEAWGFDSTRGRAFYTSLLERVRALPGVTEAGLSDRLPLTFATSSDEIFLTAPSSPDERGPRIDLSLAGPGYLDAIGMRLVAGRGIGEGDIAGAPRVAVVNETMAKRHWPDGAVGRTFLLRGETVTIVGILRDAKYGSLTEEVPAFAYFPVAQQWQPNLFLAVRGPASVAEGIREAVAAFDPLLPRPTVISMVEANRIVLLPQRLAATVTAVLGGVGLLLATVGLYGMIAQSVGRRTRELGLRVALGAQRGDVLRLVVGEGMRLAGVGVVVGLVLAMVATRLLASMLFGVSPLDGLTFVGMTVVLTSVAMVASYLPARRVSRADPMLALRTD
ncbi:MAG: ABC transporter permease [Gemmatimonadetes bacterium]|nr:ABC transporter permease [Gemmatimonadota bacterium]